MYPVDEIERGFMKAELYWLGSTYVEDEYIIEIKIRNVNLTAIKFTQSNESKENPSDVLKHYFDKLYNLLYNNDSTENAWFLRR
jgi:hypothetical protein